MPQCRIDNFHRWSLAGTNNQPRVVTRNTSAFFVFALVSSEWRDSNPRPPGPKPGALPSCATFREAGSPPRPQMIPVFSVERKALGVNRVQYLMKRMILHHSATSCSQCIGSIHDWLKRGYVGDAVLLSIIVVELDQQKFTHKRPLAQLLVLGVLPRTRSPDHGVRCIRLIRAAGAES